MNEMKLATGMLLLEVGGKVHEIYVTFLSTFRYA